jgi:hypothetical protein
MLHGVDFVLLSPFAVLLSVFLHPLWVLLQGIVHWRSILSSLGAVRLVAIEWNCPSF